MESTLDRGQAPGRSPFPSASPSPAGFDAASPTPIRDQTALHRLLDAELDFSPRASGPYISHLAMSLIAAHRLGADDRTLEEWYRAQTSDGFLVPRTRPSWLEPDTAAILQNGIDGTVSTQLPALIGSPSSQFFHAAIRLELAVDAGHAGQVANALRNWGDANTAIAPSMTGEGRSTFAEVLSRLAASQSLTGTGLDLGHVASDPLFGGTMGELMAYESLLDDVALTVAEHHLEAGNFSTLHLVTGTRAARALIGFLDAPTAATFALSTAQAVAAALVGLGLLTSEARARATTSPAATNPAGTDRKATSPNMSRSTTSTDDIVSWEAINRRALETHDPHVVKLVYACFLEERAAARPIHREVAARQVGLSSPSRT